MAVLHDIHDIHDINDIKDRLIEVILDHHASIKNQNTLTLNSLRIRIDERNSTLQKELNLLIQESMKEDSIELPLIQFLLRTILLLELVTQADVFLNAHQQQHIKTTLGALLMTCHDLLSSKMHNPYVNIGLQIVDKLKNQIDLHAIQEEEILFQISKFIDAYQVKVEPKHLRSENERLKLEMQQLQVRFANLERQNSTLKEELTKNGIRRPITKLPSPDPRVFGPLFTRPTMPGKVSEMPEPRFR